MDDETRNEFDRISKRLDAIESGKVPYTPSESGENTQDKGLSLIHI